MAFLPMTGNNSDRGAHCGDYPGARRSWGGVAPRVDALATDVRFGAYKRLKLAVIARATWPMIRILVISGFDDSRLRAEAAGVNAAYLLKPVLPEHLITTLQSMAEPGEGNRRSD
ncbi:MAG: hypothetical protein ABIS06_09880 [Vicinamibacterales bacterium]